MKEWDNWVIQYWNQSPTITDCYSNSKYFTLKARTESEAIRKFKRQVFSDGFRFGEVFNRSEQIRIMKAYRNSYQEYREWRENALMVLCNQIAPKIPTAHYADKASFGNLITSMAICCELGLNHIDKVPEERSNMIVNKIIYEDLCKTFLGERL